MIRSSLAHLALSVENSKKWGLSAPEEGGAATSISTSSACSIRVRFAPLIDSASDYHQGSKKFLLAVKPGGVIPLSRAAPAAPVAPPAVRYTRNPFTTPTR